MEATQHTPKSSSRPPNPKPEYVITRSVKQWLSTLPGTIALAHHPVDTLVAQAPKRHTIYEPMALLPSGSFSSPAWRALLSDPNLDSDLVRQLWEDILSRLSRSRNKQLTRLAVNEGIPPLSAGENNDCSATAANFIRAPSALRTLYGDFGPAEGTPYPSGDDFDNAFWVTTKQVGFQQTWAPRWTMFSRGNIKEKERILTFHTNPATDARDETIFSATQDAWAVDMYAGIGYFTFAYAKQGARVLCWEINPWSVEALRRGAVANGWSVRVVQGEALALPTPQLVDGGKRIVVFLEDNQKASERIQELRDSGHALNILHVNCGLLPTSDLVWRASWDMTGLNQTPACWLHLHENVGVSDIERRRVEIETRFESWAAADSAGQKRSIQVQHVEKVKTYAPDIWHCVFDVYITNTNNT